MNSFDKTFMLGFYNSFLKTKLNCHKENMLVLNTYSFQKKMFSDLVIDFKDRYVMKTL